MLWVKKLVVEMRCVVLVNLGDLMYGWAWWYMLWAGPPGCGAGTRIQAPYPPLPRPGRVHAASSLCSPYLFPTSPSPNPSVIPISSLVQVRGSQQFMDTDGFVTKRSVARTALRKIE